MPIIVCMLKLSFVSLLSFLLKGCHTKVSIAHHEQGVSRYICLDQWWPTSLLCCLNNSATCRLVRSIRSVVIIMSGLTKIQYIPAVMHRVRALVCFAELCFLTISFWPHFYQTRSAWSMDQLSNENHSPVNSFAPTVTKFWVMWEGQALPHDTKFGNCRDKIVDSRAFLSWSLIHGSSWSGLIKVGPGLLHWQSYNCPSVTEVILETRINTLHQSTMTDNITTTKQSKTKPRAYIMGYIVVSSQQLRM